MKTNTSAWNIEHCAIEGICVAENTPILDRRLHSPIASAYPAANIRRGWIGALAARAKTLVSGAVSRGRVGFASALLLALVTTNGIAATAQIAAGKIHSTALSADGSLWTWGENVYGQLGDGTNLNRSTPQQVGAGFTTISASSDHTAAIKSDGSLWTWGFNNRGQLGDGTAVDRVYPTQIGNDFVSVAAGYEFTMAIKSDGSLWAWGWNLFGQLGDGTNASRYSPVQIDTGYIAVATGVDHSLAIKSNGTLWAWGGNSSGQLGDGTTMPQFRPMQISTSFLTGAPPVAVSAGLQYSAVLMSDGSLWMWGNNSSGQLGDDSTITRFTPVKIGDGFTSVKTGDDHTAATKSDGSLWAWGSNGSGQLGDGTLISRTLPVRMTSAFSAVTVGAAHTLALKSDGSLWAWGNNLSGQLGDGTTTARLSPIQVGSGFTVDTATSPLTGLWWNQNEPGWGISITQHTQRIFAAWYTFDQNGLPLWYVISDCPVSGSGCSGDMYRVDGGSSPGQPWNGAGKIVTKVGTGSFSFSDNNIAAFNYTLNNVTGTKLLSRQIFANGSVAPAVNYSDQWWNPSESGWGVALTQQYDTLFATWYAYDNAGKPVWYVASSCPLSSNGCVGDLYQVTGGSAPNMPWNESSKRVTRVGAVTFTFNDSNTAVMNYIVNGESGSRAITRQSF